MIIFSFVAIFYSIPCALAFLSIFLIGEVDIDTDGNGIPDDKAQILSGSQYDWNGTALTETVLAQIDRELHARELVKVSVLEGADESAKDYLKQTAEIFRNYLPEG